MKKIFLMTLLLAFCVGHSLMAQDHLEIKAESASTSVVANPEDALVVTIEGDYPAYTIILFDSEPWKGAQPIQTINEYTEKIYRFQNLEPGEYYVCVLDAKENMDCRKAQVERR